MKLITAAALTVVLFCAPNASAFVPEDCVSYGESAVKQQQQNKFGECGFVGPRWHLDVGAHQTFCQIFGTDKAREETGVRQARLDGCLAEAAPQDEPPEVADCRKSDIAEGKGATSQQARNMAQDQLGFQRAQMINDGYNKCIFNDLGCTGGNNDKTCYLSVSCCLPDSQ
ncbi:MAG: hypothetical protein GY798_09205 [Hyphomicrobiales bacterium]|nr:hypothetical protein [Hyphomicrobiales bacterium]